MNSLVQQHSINNQSEELFVVGLIISQKFMEGVEHVLETHFFQSKHLAVIASWCLDYFDEFHEIPGKAIKEIFIEESKFSTVPDQELIEILLKSTFKRYVNSEFNAKYLLPKALSWIRERSLEYTIEKSSWLLKRKGPEEAEACILEHEKVTEKTSEIRDASFLRNFDKQIDSWWYASEDPALTLPGALGKYLHPLLPGKLGILLAGPKAGKSWHLQYLAYMALTQRKNVIFFSLEMSQEECLERFTSMMLGQEKTWNSKSKEYSLPVWDCKHNQDGSCNKQGCSTPNSIVFDGTSILPYEKCPDHSPCEFCRGDKDSLFKTSTWVITETRDSLTKSSITKQVNALKRHFGLDNLKFFNFGIGTVDVSKIESILNELEQREGWLPDLVCVDYGDLLKPSFKFNEKRHQLSNIFENLSRIAKERNVLLMTASQVNRAASKKANLDIADVSEDFGKIMIADFIISINSDNDYKNIVETDRYWNRHSLQLLISRYHKGMKNWQKILCLHNFDLGQPIIDSELIG